MCPHLQRDPAGRHFPEYRIPSARRGCHRSFTGDFSHFVQDAVAAGAVPQVDPYRESLLRGCSPFSFRLRGRLLLVLDGDILFHKPVSFCTSSSASIWELTAPCGRPAFSFHLRGRIVTERPSARNERRGAWMTLNRDRGSVQQVLNLAAAAVGGPELADVHYRDKAVAVVRWSGSRATAGGHFRVQGGDEFLDLR